MTRGRLTALALTAVALVTACQLVLSPAERRALEAARARWEASGITAYTVESRYLCFCGPHLLAWTRLTIRGDSVVATEPLEPLPRGAEPDLAGWRTVSQLFTTIAEADRDDILEDVTATYDAALGYPRTIALRCTPAVADCGITYELRNLQPN